MDHSDPVAGELPAASVGRDMASRTDPLVLDRLVWVSRVFGAAVSLLGAVVIVGWITDVKILTSISPGLASMRFNAAFGLVLVGASVVALCSADRPKVVLLGGVARAVYGVLGALTLAEYATGHRLGFDNPFGFDTVGSAPGRIAPTTAVCFVTLALSVSALRSGRPRLGQVAGLAVVAVASLAVVGYLFGATSLYRVGATTAMAPHTAVAFVLAGLAVLAARADEGFVALLTEGTAGGVTVRRMLVPAVAGPMAVGGLLDWAARADVVTAELRLAIFTVCMVVLATILVWLIGSSLRHVDLRRAGAEDALDQVNLALTDRNQALALLSDALAELRSNEERFRASVEHIHESLSVFSAIRDDGGSIVDFRWDFANTASSLVAGCSPSDLEGRTLMKVLSDHGPSGMLDIYAAVVETGEPYVEPSLWTEDVKRDGRRRRAFDVRATKFGDGLVVVTREVTERREEEAELARQRHELERSNKEMKLLNNLADMLQSCAGSEEAYAVLTQSCAALFPDHPGSISVMHPSRDILEVESAWGDPTSARSFAPADCWALRRGRPYVSGSTGPRCTHLRGSTTSHCLCVPMLGQGDIMGIVHVAAPATDADQIASEDLESGPSRQLAVTIAGQISMALANLRLRDSLREMSIRDPLTGLFNRRYMEETLERELSRAARHISEVAILVIDVDHFKAFNDTYGHAAGDAVLEAVGVVLTRFSRNSDIACRYGGEEFVVILPSCSLEHARFRADELRRRVAALRVPFRNIALSGPTISCGVAAFPVHGHAAGDLIHAADAALYRAKHAGRDQVMIALVDQGSAAGDVPERDDPRPADRSVRQN